MQARPQRVDLSTAVKVCVLWLRRLRPELSAEMDVVSVSLAGVGIDAGRTLHFDPTAAHQGAEPFGILPALPRLLFEVGKAGDQGAKGLLSPHCSGGDAVEFVSQRVLNVMVKPHRLSFDLVEVPAQLFHFRGKVRGGHWRTSPQ